MTDVLQTSFSDHFMTYTLLKGHTIHKHKHKFVTYRDYKNFIPDSFLTDIQQLVQVNMTTGLSRKWEAFKSEFICFSNKHAPIKKRRLKNRFCPWNTPDIVKLMYTRDHRHKLARTSGDTAQWAEYKKLRNRVTAQTREEKKNTSNLNYKKLWASQRNYGMF